MLTILILSPRLPWPPHEGAHIRIVETLRFLSAHHEVFVVAPIYSADERNHVAGLSKLCAGVHAVPVPDSATARLRRLAGGLVAGIPLVPAYHRNSAITQSLRAISARIRFDIVQIEFSFLAHYLAALGSGTEAKSILSMHNIETLRFERELAVAPWSARRFILEMDRGLFPSWEQRAVRAFDGVAAVSAAEAAWIERTAPGAIVQVVPNGVDVDYFRPQLAPPASSSVVFTGAMDYPPNVDAVLWFADEILPRLRERQPELRFVIVGCRPAHAVQALAARAGVTVTGEVEDIRPYLTEAIALVVPLRSGGGTRLKILEAMAMGRPVVSTTLGAEGLEIADGDNILIADSPERFTEEIVRLAIAPDTAARIGMAGRQLALAKYDWRQCLRGLDDLYQAVLSDKRA